MAAQDIQRETEAAKSLLANLRDIGADGDEEIVKTAIEGETNLFEVIDAALLQAAQDQASIDALDRLMAQIALRKERLSKRVDLTKAAIHSALQAIETRKLERPLATLTIKPTPASAIIVDESQIPVSFFRRPDPKLDKRALLAALKDGVDVPGAALGNGSETLQWRFA